MVAKIMKFTTYGKNVYSTQTEKISATQPVQEPFVFKHLPNDLTFAAKLHCTRSATASTVKNVAFVIDTVNATVYLQYSDTLLVVGVWCHVIDGGSFE